MITGLVMTLLAGCASDADCKVTTAKCCACDVQRAMTTDDLRAEEDVCAKKECKKPACEAVKPFDPGVFAVCKAGKCELQKPAGCKKDADCTVTTWRCCGCPQQRTVSLAALKAEEDRCATKSCLPPECGDPPPVSATVTAVCKAGTCELGKPPKAECSAAADCQVWCCQEDLGASPKGKKPRPGCKRCPNPQPAAECLEGKCSVAPHALDPK